MPRKLLLEYPEAIYDRMNRRDRREPIFSDDSYRQSFLEILGQDCGKTDWQVHAFCLMSNRFHLVVWYWGHEAFRQELLGQMIERTGAEHYLRERAERTEAKAQRIVEQEFKRLRWSAQGLESHCRGDKRKLRIARRLREETTMTLAWIAQRLRMASTTR